MINTTGIGSLVEAVVSATPDQQKQIQAILDGNSKRRKQITSKEAAEILGCHIITLRRLEKRGHLHAIRFSKRKLRWIEEDVISLANYGIATSEGGN